MNIDTLKTIYKLLKKNEKKATETVNLTRLELKRAWQALENAEGDPACGPGEVEARKAHVEACKTANAANEKKWKAAINARTDFESYDWS